jgi:3-phenylpropionate/cinnamic acid dioxygenase small subunit
MTQADRRQIASAEIRDVLSRLAHHADSGTVEEYASLFTDDATWELTSPSPAGAAADRRRGRNDIADGVRERRGQGLQGPGSYTRHVITTVAIELVGLSEAAAVSYWMFYADTASFPRLMAMGQYDDRFTRSATGWLLGSRRITVG